MPPVADKAVAEVWVEVPPVTRMAVQAPIPPVMCGWSAVDAYMIRSLPQAWASLRDVDNCERASKGRALLWMDDLEHLGSRVDALMDDQSSIST